MVVSKDKSFGRQTYIDVYKGIAILLVILGHLHISSILYRFIFIFHMYAFFFVSGITFKYKKEQRFTEILISYVKRLIMPYLFFAFAWDFTNMILEIYKYGTFDFSPIGIVKNIAAVVVGGGFESSAAIGPAWFLMALFVVKIAFWLIAKLTWNNRILMGVICVILFIFGYICNGLSFLPFKIFSCLTPFLFVYCGYIFKDSIASMRKYKVIYLLIGSILLMGLTFVASVMTKSNLVLVSNNLPKEIGWTILGSFGGCFGLVLVSMMIERIEKVSKVLTFYGINSLVIMGVHSEINMLMQFVLERTGISDIAEVAIIFTVTVMLCVPIAMIFNKHFPLLVGRQGGKNGNL